MRDLTPEELHVALSFVRAMRGTGVDEDPDPQDLASRISGDIFLRLDGQGRTALRDVVTALAAATANRRAGGGA